MSENILTTDGKPVDQIKSRNLDIDRAKGLAIILVVFGHVVARTPPVDNEWYTVAKHAVYSFHMPFFMFLSGFAFFLNLKPVTNWTDFSSKVGKYFWRLMPAYFLFGGIVLFGKYTGQNFLLIDNPVNSLLEVVNIVLFPMQSVSAFLWYIYILFIYYIFTLFLFSLSKINIWLLVLVGIFLQFMPMISFLGIGQFSKHYLFFALGGAAVFWWGFYTKLLDKIWWLAMAIFVFVVIAALDFNNSALLISLLSIPALHGMCRLNFPGNKILLYLGGVTFSIYLMNTIFIGLTKSILMKFASWDGSNFVYIFFPCLMLMGLLAPIYLKKKIFPKINWLNKITG